MGVSERGLLVYWSFVWDVVIFLFFLGRHLCFAAVTMIASPHQKAIPKRIKIRLGEMMSHQQHPKDNSLCSLTLAIRTREGKKTKTGH